MAKKKVEKDNAIKSLYVVFDTETTGLSARKQDVVQVAGIIFRDGLELQRFNFTCQPHDWGTIAYDALEINGHTVDKMKTYPQPHVTCKALRDILDSYIDKDNPEEVFQLIAHNMPFDHRFLLAWWEKCGFDDFFKYFLPQDECICTKKWGNRANKQLGWGLENGKLITFAKHFNFQFDAHDALGDTLACAHVMTQLLHHGIVMVCGGPSAEELHAEGKLTQEEIEAQENEGEEAPLQDTDKVGAIEL